MESKLEKLFNEDYNTKHAEIYKDYSVEQLEAEIQQTEALIKQRMANGEILTSGGLVHVPGTIKLQVLKSLLRQKKIEYDPLKEMFKPVVEKAAKEKEVSM